MTNTEFQPVTTGGGQTPASSWLAENVWLVAALLLPLAVVGFFLISAALPRMTIAPPQHDFVLSAQTTGGPSGRQHALAFAVRDGRIVADVRPIPAGSFAQRESLFLFEAATTDVREIPVDVPADLGADESRTFVVEALASRTVVSQTRAPDGYAFEARHSRGPGLVGELFGMRSSEPRGALVKDGRAVSLALPISHAYGLTAIGWLDR